jgi:hypothetical protein
MNLKNIFRIIGFSNLAIFEEAKGIKPSWGIAGFILNVFIFVIPTDLQSLKHLPYNYVVGLIGFMMVFLIISLLKLLLDADDLNITQWFYAMNLFFFYSLFIISLPAFLISYWIVSVLFNNQILAIFLFTLIPYYNFIFFGFLAETLSTRDGIKGTFIALFAITLIIVFQNLLVLFIK